MEKSEHPPSVMMICLDAAEPNLIERWIEDGSLPNMKRIRERGAYGRLGSPAEWLSVSPWPTFFTGTPPSQHGFYYIFGWCSSEMKFQRVNQDWMPNTPFWWRFKQDGPRAVIIDTPHTYKPPKINGMEIRGWTTYEILGPSGGYPQSKLDWARKNFGEIPLTNERYETFSAHESLKLRDQMIEITRKLTDLSVDVSCNEQWDFFLVTFATSHRGSHKLWGSVDIKGEIQPEELEEFNEALRQIYIECDRSIGRLVDTAGEKTTVLIFSVHGMGANTSRVAVLPEMLDRILTNGNIDDPGPDSMGILRKLRQLVPSSWRYEIKHRLPIGLQDRLGMFWRKEDINWSETQAFCLLSDSQGYIRVNLKGRESLGIVEPGQEYDQLCQKIMEGLYTFIDADTKEPLIQEVNRSDQLFPPGNRMNNLPDLIVKWSETPAYKHREISSASFGSIAWPTPGHDPDGRSGNHRGQGFIIATGKGFAPGSTITNAHIQDLAPTVLDLLGVPKNPEMVGESLIQ
jgi:predicted AlkP superfamily phosphohydrolase/phosphomutase